MSTTHCSGLVALLLPVEDAFVVVCSRMCFCSRRSGAKLFVVEDACVVEAALQKCSVLRCWFGTDVIVWMILVLFGTVQMNK
jgi:hypothetical protein